MKGNYATLQEFVKEVERVEMTKQDFLPTHNQIKMPYDNSLEVSGVGVFQLNDVAHAQVAEKFSIPKRYYDQMASIPGLRSHNVNSWLAQEPAKKKLLRTLDGKGRAFLADSFPPYDNFMVLSSFMPVVKDFAEVQIMSSSLTEKKMYLQVVFPKIEGEVKKGDVVRAGMIISNSEVGLGAVDIRSVIWRLVCGNGMIGESILKQYHVGRGIEAECFDIYASDTIKAELESFKLRLRDTLKAGLSEAAFHDRLKKLTGATMDVIPNPFRAVENVTKRFGFTEVEKESMAASFMIEGDTSRWGLANAITSLAKSVPDADRQFDIERAGHDLIHLKPEEWKVIIEE